MRTYINSRNAAVAAAAFSLLEIGVFSRCVSRARASEVDIGAEQDATLLGGTDATTNNSLADPGIYAGTDGDGNPKRGLIEFNIAAVVPAGATITGVQLQLTEGQYAGMGGGGGGGTTGPETISLYDETQAWGQPTNFAGATSFDGTGHGAAPDPGDAAWNYSFYGTTTWTIPGGDWSSSLTDIADASVTGTLTSFTWSSAAMVSNVQNWLDNPTANFGWILKNADETDIRTFRAFWSAQGAAANDDPALAPELLVSYVAASTPANLTWNNAGGATPSDGQTWDINNNKNWNNGSTPNTVYTDGSNVTFNDSNNAATNGGTNANAYNVTLNTLVTPSSVTVNNSLGNYTISGTGTIGGTGSLTKSGTATLTLSTPNTFSGGTTVSNGRLVIEPTSPTTSALPRGALMVSGGTVQLADNVIAGTALGTNNVILTSLSITGNGTLDIGNNRIIIDYGTGSDPIASIEQWIKNGFYDLTGPQIVSSDIAVDDAASGLSYGIGYADGADGVVAGLPSGEIEIMFTLLGDANLDRTVNSEDYTPFSHNIGQSGMMWDDGDFNYDGTVNAEDYTLFSHNIGQSAVFAAGALDPASNAGLANVPEPMGVGMMVMAALGILQRRRRGGADKLTP
jgi:autotransporter-associated beta strand protein